MSGLKVTTGVLVLAPLLLSIGGCSLSRKFTVNACNKPQPYQSQKSDPPLKIPALNEPAPPPRTVHDPCLDSPPSYKVAKPAPAPQA